jgi:NAD(P)-dependent dehydrogenase (short-subunit alcohol dehydrogenase family)
MPDENADMARDVLLVTGGGRGIGAAIVEGAVLRGYRVAFSYRENAAAANALAERLGERVRAVPGDVADEHFAGVFFDLAEKSFGPVTALVNNAGITGGIGPFAQASAERLRRTVEVNLMGTMWMAREAVRRWQAAAIPGRMVNTSSVAARLGSPGEYVHYAATKAAVEALTIGLGKEVAASGIRVNAVAPGTVYTDIHAASGEPGRPARVVSRVPMTRIAEPMEIANAALWLLSPEASYVTATVLDVAGGL